MGAGDLNSGPHLFAQQQMLPTEPSLLVSLLLGRLSPSSVKPDFLVNPEGALPGAGLHEA